MKSFLLYTFFSAIIFYGILPADVQAQSGSQWRIHETERPQPTVVTPPKGPTAPSDAIVLFDGKDLSGWQRWNGEAPTWVVKDGYMEVRQGSIQTKRGFGDCQLHVEWMIPTNWEGSGQGGYNSGVYLMKYYEIQVLNSFKNNTYPDGQAGAIYGQFPPMVNSMRPPGEWQTYDIIFHRPRFDASGKVVSPAYMTVLHNGVVIHNHRELLGPTEWQEQRPYSLHPDKLPVMLQDHGNPVRFRNIWVRELEPNQRPAVYIPYDKRKNYFGEFKNPGDTFVIKDERDGFAFYINGTYKYDIFPESETHFYSKKVNAEIDFKMDSNGKVTGMVKKMGGGTYKADKVK